MFDYAPGPWPGGQARPRGVRVVEGRHRRRAARRRDARRPARAVARRVAPPAAARGDERDGLDGGAQRGLPRLPGRAQVHPPTPRPATSRGAVRTDDIYVLRSGRAPRGSCTGSWSLGAGWPRSRGRRDPPPRPGPIAPSSLRSLRPVALLPDRAAGVPAYRQRRGHRWGPCRGRVSPAAPPLPSGNWTVLSGGGHGRGSRWR